MRNPNTNNLKRSGLSFQNLPNRFLRWKILARSVIELSQNWPNGGPKINQDEEMFLHFLIKIK